MSGVTHKDAIYETFEDWAFKRGDGQIDGLVKLAGWVRRIGASEAEIISVLYAFRNRFAEFDKLERHIPRIARKIVEMQPAEIRFRDLSLERAVDRARQQRTVRERIADARADHDKYASSGRHFGT